MKIAIVCSHGGHLTEMLYLMDAFKGHEVFFITYDHYRTRRLPYRKYLFPNFGENPLRVLKYLPSIFKILVKERPDVLISNGAEIAIPFFYLAKLLGVKTIFIECYTRIYKPTITGKLVYPISDVFIVLWEEMLHYYGNKAIYLGSLITKQIKTKYKKRINLIFVVTGTHFKGFDRLVQIVDELAELFREYIFLVQIGNGKYKPKRARQFKFAEYKKVKKLFSFSRLTITQGAISIIDALAEGTPVVSFPRLSRYGEVSNDHQFDFSKKLEEMGLVRVATNKEELAKHILLKLDETSKESVKIEPNKKLVSLLRERWFREQD